MRIIDDLIDVLYIHRLRAKSTAVLFGRSSSFSPCSASSWSSAFWRTGDGGGILLVMAEREPPLYEKMYFRAHYVDLVRMVGYAGLPMQEARDRIKELTKCHDKEKLAKACEELFDIDAKDVKLKANVRRLAFQLLGAPPEYKETTIAEMIGSTAKEDMKPEPKARTTRRKTPLPPAEKGSLATTAVPLMQQYRAAKEKHPEMILLFRVGDFYEVFDADADTLHKLLGLTLTTRDQTIRMAGFPHHQLETYLHKLLKEGQRVAICEPAEESLARGPIRRDVTRVVTLGADNETQPVKQPRHFVLKRFQEWMNQQGLAFVAIDDVKKTTPAVAPYIAGLDFIVLRGEDKLLVTVRPTLPAKNGKAAQEVQKLFGAPYRPVRIWPSEAGGEWRWDEFPIEPACDVGSVSDRK